ncbi:MAG TPA: phospholipase D-like domain-containing protein [Jiangellaceae bacterium]
MVSPSPQQAEESERHLRRTLECLIGIHFTEGNEITVLRNGDEIFPAMLDAIGKAERTVDFMTYVYWKGQPARDFANALSDRARAGVRVRLLIDAVGGLQIEDGLVDAMAEAGVDVQWFRRPWMNSPFKQNHRCHRKVCIIDERIGFTGGVGIAEEWCGDARDETEWRDTHFRVEGPAVDGLAAAFAQDWAETGRELYDDRDRFPEQSQSGKAVIQVVRGSASIGWDDIHTVWYVLMRSARRSIQLQSAYFSPDQQLIDALCGAAKNGVEVDILVPGPHADKRVTQLASEATYAELISCGVRVWNYQPSMLHTKVMIIDGSAALIGSSNVNRRSLDHDEEVSLVVLDQATVQTLQQHFREDLERSRAIDLTRWENRPARQRVLEAAVAPIRRWL